jgi:E3 ubiquitin-protein ligase BRE1
MDAEVKLCVQAKLPASSSTSSSNSSSGSSSTSSVDKDMLDMTLNMLRCYVCRDRFKNAVITRCYHLFCKECIDENLKSRLRKCPACGEKFGQDDVKMVYFTH